MRKKRRYFSDATTTYLVLPKDMSQNEINDNLINIKNVGCSANNAWDKFVYPALNRDAYEIDGYRAVKVKLMFEIVEE